MPRLHLAVVCCGLLACIHSARAEERWVEIRSGPFDVMSAIGDRAARDQMMQLEQFRNALGTIIGKQDPTLIWPLRVIVRKNADSSRPLALARDAYITDTGEKQLLDRSQMRALAKLLIDQNTSRLPPDIEDGLIELFSTLQVTGTHVVLGTPVPVSERNRNWARMHLLNVDPSYAGRAPALIVDLQHGADRDAAYRNAFEKPEAEIERQVDAYLAAGTFATINVSARALSAARDFHPEGVDSATSNLIEADLLLAAGSPEADVEYNKLHGPGAAEGLALIALRGNDKSQARILFQSALADGTKSARAWLEAGLLEAEKPKAWKDFDRAAQLNPLWPEPLFRKAQIAPDAAQKLELLKKATALDPRNRSYWVALAQAAEEAQNFAEAQKAWSGAERAALTEDERQQIRNARLKVSAERADAEEAERRRKADEEARDLARVRDASLAAIRRAEQEANHKLNPTGAPLPPVVAWNDVVQAPAQVTGMLLKFECLGAAGRLTVRTRDGKNVLLLVPDKSQLPDLTCGDQKPARGIVAHYTPTSVSTLGTSGEVASIELR